MNILPLLRIKKKKKNRKIQNKYNIIIFKMDFMNLIFKCFKLKTTQKKKKIQTSYKIIFIYY